MKAKVAKFLIEFGAEMHLKEWDFPSIQLMVGNVTTLSLSIFCFGVWVSVSKES